MSAKKSWDVQPRRAARPAPAPSRRGVSVDAVRTTRNMNVSRTSDGRLRERRKKARKTGLIISLITLLLFFVLLLYLLWLPAVRIQTVEASGPNAEEAAQTARESISGTYLYVLPRNSIFFFPKERVRKTVLAAHPQISALSVSRKSFTSIQLSGTSRASSFVWCGVHIDAAFPGGQCFEADAEGLVFKEAGISTTTSVLSTGSDTPATSGDLRIYSPLEREGIRKAVWGVERSGRNSHIHSLHSLPWRMLLIQHIGDLSPKRINLTLCGRSSYQPTAFTTRVRRKGCRIQRIPSCAIFCIRKGSGR